MGLLRRIFASLFRTDPEPEPEIITMRKDDAAVLAEIFNDLYSRIEKLEQAPAPVAADDTPVFDVKTVPGFTPPPVADDATDTTAQSADAPQGGVDTAAIDTGATLAQSEPAA